MWNKYTYGLSICFTINCKYNGGDENAKIYRLPCKDAKSATRSC